MGHWSIHSSNGWRRVSFEAVTYHAASKQIECRIVLVGEYWNRPALASDPSQCEEMAEDFNATFPSVLIPIASAHELLKCLDRWLISKTTFTAAVCSGPDQEVVLRLGEREDLLATRDKEAFTLYYSASGCRMEVYFIVDSSCVRIARDGLARELALLDSNET